MTTHLIQAALLNATNAVLFLAGLQVVLLFLPWYRRLKVSGARLRPTLILGIALSFVALVLRTALIQVMNLTDQQVLPTVLPMADVPDSWPWWQIGAILGAAVLLIVAAVLHLSAYWTESGRPGRTSWFCLVLLAVWALVFNWSLHAGV